MTNEEAQQVAAAGVKAAAERDTGSGNGVFIANVTDEGVEISDYDLDEIDV
jgi:proteasome beta subunit